MRPRLRSHVQITRQHYRGRRWHVVHDPTSNHFYRLSPVAHEFVGLLDGKRPVDDAWKLTLQTHGDDAPTQQEVVELLSQLYNSNLLSADATPETEQLLRRGRDRTKQRLAQQAIGIMYFRMRLFNPDPIIARVEPILRPAINIWGFLAWCALVVSAIAALVPHTGVLFGSFENAIAPANWPWLAVVFVITKVFHELGHGVICKRFGGLVPEFGAMLLVLFPAPYVDASACWAFPSKWRRIAVGAGGMLFELTLASVAAFIWIAQVKSGSDGIVRQLMYNAMFTAGVSTVLFNANPLMRFDGYYILSDLLEAPNLMQRSTQMLQHLAKKYLFAMPNTRPPATSRGEQALLIVYGAAATVYRMFLFFSITLYVMSKLFGIGLVLAIWTAAAWFLLPSGKFIHYLTANPQLHDRRQRAVFVSLAILAAAVIGLGMIPAPDRRHATGVVEADAGFMAGVFARTTGFVEQCHVREGEIVAKGEPVLTLASAELTRAIDMGIAQRDELESRLRDTQTKSPAAAVRLAEQLALVEHQVEFLRERERALIITAPISGRVLTDPSLLVGSYVREGQEVCQVLDPLRVHVNASLSTVEARPLLELQSRGETYKVEFRRYADVARSVEGVDPVVLPGTRLLAHPAMTFAGGGQVEPQQGDESGMVAKRPRFPMIVRAPEGATVGVPGERVAIRVTLSPRPLAAQWIDRVRRIFQGLVDI